MWNFQETIRLSSATKQISRIFDFGGLRSGQFGILPITRQREENQIPPMRIRTGYFITNWTILDYWSRCKFWSVRFIEVAMGHMTLSAVTDRFWLITNEWKELGTWAWSHCACIVKMHRLICNMTYLGQLWPQVTLTWYQILTDILKITMYVIRRGSKRETRWYPN